MGALKENLQEYLASEEGRDYIKKIMKELLVDSFSAQQKLAQEQKP